MARDNGTDPRSCFWCRRQHGLTIGLDESFLPHLGGPVAFGHDRIRHVATPAGERRSHMGIGSPIIYIHPPKPNRGKLQGPLLHPDCRCELEIVSAKRAARTPRPEHGDDRKPQSAQAPQISRSARSTVRFHCCGDPGLPEDRYRALIAFLTAASHDRSQLVDADYAADGEHQFTDGRWPGYVKPGYVKPGDLARLLQSLMVNG